MYHGILTRKQDGDCMEESIEVAFVAFNLSLFDTTTKGLLFIPQDNFLRNVNLMFKCGFIVLKLVKNSAVVHLPIDSDVET